MPPVQTPATPDHMRRLCESDALAAGTVGVMRTLLRNRTSWVRFVPASETRVAGISLAWHGICPRRSRRPWAAILAPPC